MGNKNRTIPFALHPSSWGVRGDERARTEARYYLDGEDLERRLLELEFSGILTPHDEKDFKYKKLALDLKWGKIQKIDYDKAIASIDYPNKKSVEYKRALLDIKLEHGEIEQVEYDKSAVELQYKDKDSQEYQIALANIERTHGELDEHSYAKRIATIKNEPWVRIVEAKINYDAESGNGLEFELDWNEAFVEELFRNGYRGASQSEIVDEWFTQTCHDMFSEENDFIVDEMPSSTTTRRKNDNGQTEFS